MNPNNIPGPEAARNDVVESATVEAEQMAASAAAGEGGFAPSQGNARSGEDLPEGDARSAHVD